MVALFQTVGLGAYDSFLWLGGTVDGCQDLSPRLSSQPTKLHHIIRINTRP